jgi:hypothetical protein
VCLGLSGEYVESNTRVTAKNCAWVWKTCSFYEQRQLSGLRNRSMIIVPSKPSSTEIDPPRSESGRAWYGWSLIIKLAFFVVCCGCLTGCLHPHLYPVCFYQAAPPQQRVQEYYAPQLVGVLQATIKDSDRLKAKVTPDGRWLVANVTKAQNAKIAKIWPRVGCIGNALDSQSTKLESDCVAYQLEFVTTKNYFTFGNARDAGEFDIWNESPVKDTLVHCHQIKEDEQQK